MGVGAALEEASARVAVPGTQRPLMPLPYVLGLQSTAAWMGSKRRRSLRRAWRRAGFIEECRPSSSYCAGGAELITMMTTMTMTMALRFDPAAARAGDC